MHVSRRLLECLKECLEATVCGIKFAPIYIAANDATVLGIIDNKTIKSPD